MKYALPFLLLGLAACQMQSPPISMSPEQAEAHSVCLESKNSDIAYAGGGAAIYEACMDRELRRQRRK